MKVGSPQSEAGIRNVAIPPHLIPVLARIGHSTPQAALRYQHAARGRDAEVPPLSLSGHTDTP